MIRRTPLKRSTKPLKRSPLKQGKGRRAKAIDALLETAKDVYFSCWFGIMGDKNFYPCQRCRLPIERHACDAHHKIKRSLRGGHGPENLVILCRPCHNWAHDESHPENLKAIRDSRANAANGEKI